MKKNILIGIIAILVITIIGIVVLVFLNQNDEEPNDNPTSNSSVQKLEIKYQQVSLNDTQEEKNKLLTSYEDYKQEMDLLNTKYILTEKDFQNNNYIELIIKMDHCHENIDSVKSLDINDNNVKIIFNLNTGCGVCPEETDLYLIPVDKIKLSSIGELVVDYNISNKRQCDPNVSYKPIIYLYPTKDMNISVKLSNPDNLTTTYPKYKDGWNVYAKKNGDLIDSNGRTYYALYWEGLTYSVDNNIREGFVVKREDSIKFLEEKLSILGLNERESNEFIMYWLPKLEQNKYNYIRFATMKEINNGNKLDITPTPDSVIRILMLYKPLEEKIEVEEQMLETPSRTGFTVVEWGGVNLK